MSVGYYITWAGQTIEYCTVTVDHKPRYTSAGSLESYDYTYKISAWMRYSSTSDMVTAIGTIRTALNTGGGTLKIYDTAGTTAYSFAPSDCNGDGPYASYSFAETAGNSFRLEMEFTGNVPPTGSGETVDDYSDDYSADATGQYTWTRAGTLRNSSAWTDQADALADADPAPSASIWELVSKTGQLDEDLKKLEYTFVYQQYWEKQSSEWKESRYDININRTGMVDEITLTGTVSPAYAIGAAESLEERAITWAKGKLPSKTVVTQISTSLDKRGGACSVTLSGIRPGEQSVDNLVEISETRTTSGRVPFVIHRPLNGGNPKPDILGKAVEEQHISGRRVGLGKYPSMPDMSSFWEYEKTYEDPSVTESGDTLYPISYSYTIYTNLKVENAGAGGMIGGGAGGNGIGGGGQPAGGGRNVVTFGDIGGFTTGGLVQGAVGGLFGASPKNVVKFRIT